MLSSQDINTDPFFQSSTTTGSIGTVTINGQVYNQLSLRPEIPFGKLGIGLDLYLYFNDDGMYWKSWNFSGLGAAYRTIVDKIYYLRWGQPGDDLYFMAGALPTVTLGQGILVYNYANIMEYPQVRQIGLNLQAKLAEIDIEFIYSNFKSATPGVLGLRGSYSILPKLNFGVSFVTDMNQLDGLPDSDGDKIPDYYDYYIEDSDRYDDYHFNQEFYDDLYVLYTQEINSTITLEEFLSELTVSKSNYVKGKAESDGVSGMAIDGTFSLTNNITLYSQLGILLGEINDTINYTGEERKLGWGFVPIGARAKLGSVKLMGEFRISSERFVFNYWDRSYDINRVSVINSNIVTRESKLYQYGKLKGIYAQAEMSVMNIVNLGIGYQNMQGEKWDESSEEYKSGGNNQTFLATIGINPTLIPKVGKAEAFYQQSNVPNPFKFAPSASTILGYNLGIEVSSRVMLLYQVRTTYISDLDKSGELLPVKSIQIETRFVF